MLAAAIRACTQVIVTANLKHFPAELLAPRNIEAKSPDDFALDQISIDDRTVFACLQAVADSRDQRPETVDDVLGPARTGGSGGVRRGSPDILTYGPGAIR